ncbi:MAG: hypothetical protein AAFN77_04495 [Planctomycetota bacterium]
MHLNQPTNYEIQCVLINSETVLNDDGVRRLELNANEWVIQPAEQRFQVEQRHQSNAVLRSNGHRYFAEIHQIDEATIELQLKRENVAGSITIEATLSPTIVPREPAHSIR